MFEQEPVHLKDEHQWESGMVAVRIINNNKMQEGDNVTLYMSHVLGLQHCPRGKVLNLLHSSTKK